jgi:hypothetical protein
MIEAATTRKETKRTHYQQKQSCRVDSICRGIRQVMIETRHAQDKHCQQKECLRWDMQADSHSHHVDIDVRTICYQLPPKSIRRDPGRLRILVLEMLAAGADTETTISIANDNNVLTENNEVI